jgi:hypothetical protein
LLVRQANLALQEIVRLLRDVDSIRRMEENPLLARIIDSARLEGNLEDSGFKVAAVAAAVLHTTLQSEINRRAA